jgi:surface protein
MQKLILLLISLSSFLSTFGATITWDGDAGDGQWTTASNWDGDVLPGPGDDVVIANGNDVTLSSGSVTVNTVKINNNASDLTIAAGATLNVFNSGTGSTLEVANGGLKIYGNVYITGGSTGLRIDGRFNNFGTGILDISGSSSYCINSTQDFSNNGTIHLDGGSTASIKTIGTDFDNTGIINITNSGARAIDFLSVFTNHASGTVNITTGTGYGIYFPDDRTLTNNGSIVISGTANNAMEIEYVNGAAAFTNNGTLQGTGTFGLNGSTLGGTVIPGLSPGTMTFAGDQEFGAGATLEVEVNGTTPGTEHDQVVVAGTATLGGTLNVAINYTPTKGDRIVIVQAGSLSGTFSSINPALPFDWNVEYNTTTGEVALVYDYTIGVWDGGAGDGQWTTANNWEGRVLPGPDDVVIIEQGNNVNLSSGTVEASRVVLGYSRRLTIQPGATLNINDFGGYSGIGVSFGSGNLYNYGTLNISVGNKGIALPSGDLRNFSTGVINISNTSAGIELGGTFTNNGTTNIDNVSGYSIFTPDVLINSGSIYINNAGLSAIFFGLELNNNTGGTININTASGYGIKSNDGYISNDGSLIINGTANDAINLDPYDPNYNGGFDNTGILQGTGTFDLGSFDIEGTVIPGMSPGTMTFNGDQIFAAGTTLEVEINGTTPGSEYDQIIVTGNATLDGVLDVTINYTPTKGDRIVIVQAGSISGTFSSINPALPFDWDIEYNTTTGEVTLVYDYTIGVWDGGAGDGQWTTADNWEGRVLPGPDDVAIIEQGSNVNLSSGTVEVSRVVLGYSRRLTIQPGATLNINDFGGYSGIGVSFGSGNLYNYGTLNISVGNKGIELPSGDLRNYSTGVINISNTSAGIELGGTFTNNGTTNIDNVPGYSIFTPDVLINSGSIEINNAGLSAIFFGLELNNNTGGTININGGSSYGIKSNDGYISNEGSLIINGTASDAINLDPYDPNLNGGFDNTGILQGTGTFDLGSFDIEGTVIPGMSPGTMTFNGDQIFAAGTTLEVEINGTTPGSEYDQIIVNGVASISGTLYVSINYTANSPDRIVILSATSISGTFSSIVPALPPTWSIDYSVNGEVALVADPNHFLSTWKTNNPGTSSSTSITIPTSGGGYSYDVDWENDGIWDNLGVTGTITHNYGTAGTYTVRIRGNFHRIFFGNTGDRQKILSIDRWGEIEWSSMAGAFYGCTNLVINATDVPNLSNVSSIANMFKNAAAVDSDLSAWDVSNITNMSSMFEGATSFNQNINTWNTSNVSDMSAMFKGATVFDQHLNSWDVSGVSDMSNMFEGASNFNGNISSWVVSSVTDMRFMFSGASHFAGDLSNWDVSIVTDMSRMFSGAGSFNSDVSTWQTGSVTSMNSMFNGAAVFNGDVSNWDVSNVVDLGNVFNGAAMFNRSLANWDVTSATTLNNLLNNCGMSATNYDNTLIAWAAQSVQSNVNFGAVNIHYCAGTSARLFLINNYGWNIFGDISDCPYTPGLWDGDAGDGEWTTAANWDGDVLPTSINDVIIDNGDAVTLSSGSVTVRSITLNNDADLTTILGTTLTVTGFTGTGIDVSGCSNCVITNNGNLTVEGGDYGIITNSELVNTFGGVITCTDNSITSFISNGPVDNSWHIFITGPCSGPALVYNGNFTNQNSATLRIIDASGVAIEGGPGTLFSNLNSGFVDIYGSSTTGFSGVNVVNSGSSFIKVRGTSTAAISASGTFDNTGGSLWGVGNYALNGNALNGTLLPGFSIGSMTFSGNQTFDAGNTMEIEVNGTTAGSQHDQVEVTGTATISGTLDATINYTPTHGDRIVFLTATTISGTFSNINPALPTNWSVDYSIPGEVALEYNEPIGIWDGDAGDGEWTTAANWSANTLPGVLDDVVINTGDVVMISSGINTVRSISLAGSSELVIENGVTLNLQVVNTTAISASCSTCNISNNGTIQIDGGSNGLSTYGNFTNGAGAMLDILNITGTGINLQGFLQFQNNGTVQIDGGSNGLVMAAGSYFENTSGSTLEIANVSGNSINFTGATQFDNYGLVDITNTGSAGILHSAYNGNVTNYLSGVIQIAGNGGGQWRMALSTGSAIYSQGTISINGGYNLFSPNLLVTPGSVFSNTGPLLGNGRFNLNGNALEGITSPGNSPGTMTFLGDQTLDATNTLVIEVNGTSPGTQHDQVIVTGNATVDGTLEVSLNYAPTNNDRIVIISAASVSGTFSSVSPALPMGWIVDYAVSGEVALVYSLPLPVELLHFSATPTADNKVLLEWETASEIDNDYFGIEKADDALNFIPLGKISGAGYSTQLQQYQFLDEAPNEGWNYYRLKQMDLDGTFDYSQVVAVYLETGKEDLYIYPNPVVESIHFSKPVSGSILLINQYGQEVWHMDRLDNTEKLSLPELPSGNYKIQNIWNGKILFCKQLIVTKM